MTLNNQPLRMQLVESGIREQMLTESMGLDAGVFDWGSAAVLQEPLCRGLLCYWQLCAGMDYMIAERSGEVEELVYYVVECMYPQKFDL